jgi:hypothetical protein
VAKPTSHTCQIRARANRIRGYTNKVHLRGLRENQGFEPTKVGFACVDAVSNRPFNPRFTSAYDRLATIRR